MVVLCTNSSAKEVNPLKELNPVKIQNNNFYDNNNCQMQFRGINLSGTSKLPINFSNLYDTNSISFVGRPFSLKDGPRHFERLKNWGFNLVRFVITWEAIEPHEPGVYDEKYIEYIVKVIKMAGQYGLYAIVDCHQDIWSRFCGGDGAPWWTMDIVGMDVSKFKDTRAAFIDNLETHHYTKIFWPVNYFRYAAATMFTLFFGGSRYAPKTQYNNLPIDEYLQTQYIKAFSKIAERVSNFSHVIGYDVVNEPSCGYIGHKSLDKYQGPFKYSEIPAPIDSFALASGIPRKIPLWDFAMFFMYKKGSQTFNTNKISLWKDGYKCPWQKEGVWDYNPQTLETKLLKPDYFNKEQSDFNNDFLKKFILKFKKSIQPIHNTALFFFEDYYEFNPINFSDKEKENLVYAPHWYDLVNLFKKDYNSFFDINPFTLKPAFGKESIQTFYNSAIEELKQKAHEVYKTPVLIGEFGLPFDLGNKKDLQKGCFKKNSQALRSYYHAMEKNVVSSSIWNYTPDNIKEHGDYWNGEDFSIFSLSLQTDPNDINSGGRALESVVRPYIKSIPGELISFCFDEEKGTLIVEFSNKAEILVPLTIFLPSFQYKNGYTVLVTDGSFKSNEESWELYYYPSNDIKTHKITISRAI